MGQAAANVSEDGGGIRGLSELIIIQELMERIKWHKELPETPVPADYFDLIGGTSTGGLVFQAWTLSCWFAADLLALLQYSLADFAYRPPRLSDTTRLSPRRSSLTRKEKVTMEFSRHLSSKKQLNMY